MNNPEIVESTPDLEETPEPNQEDKKPTNKQELKYLSITGFFNRSHKRETARRIEHNKQRRRAVKLILCSYCQQSYTGKINRCQCKVTKGMK